MYLYCRYNKIINLLPSLVEYYNKKQIFVGNSFLELGTP